MKQKPQRIIAKRARQLRRAVRRGRVTQVESKLRAFRAAAPLHTPLRFQPLVREALLARETLGKRVELARKAQAMAIHQKRKARAEAKAAKEAAKEARKK